MYQAVHKFLTSIPHLVIAYARSETIMRITVRVYSRELEDMTFKEITQVIKKEFETKEKIGHCGEDGISVRNSRTE